MKFDEKFELWLLDVVHHWQRIEGKFERAVTWPSRKMRNGLYHWSTAIWHRRQKRNKNV